MISKRAQLLSGDGEGEKGSLQRNTDESVDSGAVKKPR